jgi:hypothetical protein
MLNIHKQAILAVSFTGLPFPSPNHHAPDLRAASVLTGKLITSLPMLKANKLSYPEKTSMVLMYSFNKDVVQAGEARLIDPLRGRDTSSLR